MKKAAGARRLIPDWRCGPLVYRTLGGEFVRMVTVYAPGVDGGVEPTAPLATLQLAGSRQSSLWMEMLPAAAAARLIDAAPAMAGALDVVVSPSTREPERDSSGRTVVRFTEAEWAHVLAAWRRSLHGSTESAPDVGPPASGAKSRTQSPAPRWFPRPPGVYSIPLGSSRSLAGTVWPTPENANNTCPLDYASLLSVPALGGVVIQYPVMGGNPSSRSAPAVDVPDGGEPPPPGTSTDAGAPMRQQSKTLSLLPADLVKQVHQLSDGRRVRLFAPYHRRCGSDYERCTCNRKE